MAASCPKTRAAITMRFSSVYTSSRGTFFILDRLTFSIYEAVFSQPTLSNRRKPNGPVLLGACPRRRKIASSRAEVVFNTIVPPGVGPFLEQLHKSGFTKRGGQLVCTYFVRRWPDYVGRRSRR
jgi:hypothetical protein